MRRLFRQFSFPGGIPSHVAPETPGSIHEGGELGYALAHAYGAAFDNPTSSSAASSATARRRPGRSPRAGTRTSSSNPARDGAVLPILHLNGYKIANPTVLARIPNDGARSRCSRATATRPIFVEGDDPADVHQQMAAALDDVLDEIAAIQRDGPRTERQHATGRAGR